MKYILVFFLTAFIMYSCSNDKKERHDKILVIKAGDEEVIEKEKKQNTIIDSHVESSKSDGTAEALEKGESVLMKKNLTKTTKVYNGKSFNEFLDPVDVNGIKIGITLRDELLKLMGNPDSITKEPNFVGDNGGFEERFWYKNSYFKTFDGRVQTIDLADPDFVVNESIKVGMPEQFIKKLFPVSFNSGRPAGEFWRYKGKGYDMEYAVLLGDNLLSIVTKDGRIVRILYIYSV